MNESDDLQASTILASLTPDIYQRFQTAIATGRWPDGKVLTPEQKQTCMQAVIVYENAHVPQELRTGFVPPKPTPCTDDSQQPITDEPLQWK